MRSTPGAHLRGGSAWRGGVAVAAAALLALLAAALWAPSRSAAAQPPPRPRSPWRATYAPVVRLKEQPGSCGIGRALPADRRQPADGQRRGRAARPVGRAPTSSTSPRRPADLSRGLFDYHLDFPGDALRPGCTYEEWATRLAADEPADDLRARRDPGRRARAARPPVLVLLRLQRLEQQPRGRLGDDPAQLRRGHPRAGAHPPARPRWATASTPAPSAAEWGDDKLQVVDGTHPVVYPAEGSHANFFDVADLPDAQRGRGRRAATTPAAPRAPSPPSSPRCRRRAATTSGRSPGSASTAAGARSRPRVFNGPTGPERQAPVDRALHLGAESWRDARASRCRRAARWAPSATDIFCGGGGRRARSCCGGSRPTRAASTLVIGGLACCSLWGLSRTRWEPSSPLPLARRRGAGAS